MAFDLLTALDDLYGDTEKRPVVDVSMLETQIMPTIATATPAMLTQDSGDEWVNSQPDDTGHDWAVSPAPPNLPPRREYDIPANYTPEELNALIVRACQEFYSEHGEVPFLFFHPQVALDVHLIKAPEALFYRRFVFPSPGIARLRLLCKGGTGVG